MTTPESIADPESIRRLIIDKVNLLLADSEVYEHKSIILEGKSWPLALARAIRGQKFDRLASLQIAGGYQWVGITEYSTVRAGRSKVNHIYVNGEGMGDSEGRHINHYWSYDLCSRTYSPEEYDLLAKLFDAEEGEARDEIFSQLSNYRKLHPNDMQ